MTLPDGTTLTTVTDNDGLYLFDGLVPGTYTVSVPATVDGNNPTTPITLTTTLSSGEHDPTLDFGYEPPTPLSSLGDFVWLDSDADGVQDAGEVGLAGVTVTLFNGDGTATGLSTTTDATGFYQFDDLQPGDYYVVFGAPSGYDASPANQGGDDATDSDAGVGGQSHTTTLSPGEHDPTIDAGFYQPASLGDFVWLDNDGDGVQDPGEPGIPGVTVTLTLPDGTTLTTVTDNDGLYLFDGLVRHIYSERPRYGRWQ
ncbi:MAG: carboxypeptidase regulatory-like domain-containing protein [Sphingobacteriales bacterium]|nr:carboxypeptidase regulatory-like domain-containing protein [Sphingobacteriales bacterium]